MYLKQITLFFFLLTFVKCTTPTEPVKEAKASLTKSKAPELVEGRYNVGFLIMEGVYNTELTAPFDIFQHTQYREGIKQISAEAKDNFGNEYV